MLRGRGGDAQGAALLHRLERIQEEIDQRLAQQPRVGTNPERVVDPQLHLDEVDLRGRRVLRSRTRSRQGVAHQLGELNRLQRRSQRSRVVEQVADHPVQPVRLLGDDVEEELHVALRVEQLLQAVQRVEDHAERVADLVRDRRGHLAQHSQPFARDQLALRSRQLRIALAQVLVETRREHRQRHLPGDGGDPLDLGIGKDARRSRVIDDQRAHDFVTGEERHHHHRFLVQLPRDAMFDQRRVHRLLHLDCPPLAKGAGRQRGSVERQLHTLHEFRVPRRRGEAAQRLLIVVDQQNETVTRIEQLPHRLCRRLEQRLELQRARQRKTDLVEQRHLLRPLALAGKKIGVLDRGGEQLGCVGREPDVLRVKNALVAALDQREDPERFFPRLQRHSQRGPAAEEPREERIDARVVGRGHARLGLAGLERQRGERGAIERHHQRRLVAEERIIGRGRAQRGSGGVGQEHPGSAAAQDP